jgi:MFS family permease
MLTQAGALGLMAGTTGLLSWAVAAALLGAGTAMVYPTLLAVIGDVAHPNWRASAVGVYRLWRDLGFAVGALLAGAVADRLGIPAAIWVVAGLTAASGLIVFIRMYETAPDIRSSHAVRTLPRNCRVAPGGGPARARSWRSDDVEDRRS